MTQIFIQIFLTTFVLLGCQPEKTAKRTKSAAASNTLEATNPPENDPSNSSPEEENGNNKQKQRKSPVDLTKLKVYKVDLQKTNLTKENPDGSTSSKTGLFLSFQSLANQVSYYRFVLCSQATDICEEKVTSLNGVLLPFLYAGTVEIRAAACITPDPNNPVEPKRVKERTYTAPCPAEEPNCDPDVLYRNCGPWSLPKLKNTNRDESARRDLWTRKERTIDKALAIEMKKFNRTKKFSAYLENCEKKQAAFEKNTRDKIAILHKYAKLPQHIIKETARISINIIFLFYPPVALAGTELASGIEELTKQIESDCQNDPSSGQCLAYNIGKTGVITMATGMNPLQGIEALTGNIHDLSNPESTVAIACNGSAAYAQEMNAYQSELQEQKVKLYEIKNGLVCAGEIQGRCCESGCDFGEALSQ